MPGDRSVHGNASFTPEYLLRVAQAAAADEMGLALLHSHPFGSGWQALSDVDRDAEIRVARLAHELTGLPLLGLTLSGGGDWSARLWSAKGRDAAIRECESVRVIGSSLKVSFNDALVPGVPTQKSQARTVDTWGEHTQRNLVRLRVAIVGAGSVGLPIAEALARTGIRHIGVFDFDGVEAVNLDRLRGASVLDAVLRRSKTHVAERMLARASTHPVASHSFFEQSICDTRGLQALLDYDIIFSCVDRPWPRHIMNTIAFADLIPVIDGGLRAFRNSDGSMRNAYWRTSVVRPGRRCLACLGQYDPALVQLERDGSLDDPMYIAGLPSTHRLKQRQNIAMLSAAVSAAMMLQFVSLVASPSGFGDPGPLRFNARDHRGEQELSLCDDDCSYQASVGQGDSRMDPSGHHAHAEAEVTMRRAASVTVNVLRALDTALDWLRRQLMVAAIRLLAFR